MKLKFSIFFLCLILLSSLVSAQQGGGSVHNDSCNSIYTYCIEDYFCNQTTGDCDVNMSSFTGCLVQNCDYFCKRYGFHSGEYYKENKCWCEEFIESSRGKILKDGGWIQIEECETIIPPRLPDKKELKEALWIVVKSIIIGLGLGLIFIGYIYFRLRKEKSKEGDINGKGKKAVA